MTDLIIFVGILVLVVGVGILVGMIVAGRIDRLMTPAPKTSEPGPQGSGEPEPPSTQEHQP